MKMPQRNYEAMYSCFGVRRISRVQHDFHVSLHSKHQNGKHAGERERERERENKLASREETSVVSFGTWNLFIVTLNVTISMNALCGVPSFPMS